MDPLAQYTSVLTEIGLNGLLDITVVTLAIYLFLIVLKRTRRSGLILMGIGVTGGIYVAARKLNLVLTTALLQGFFAVILVALVVIFQEDLRYFFERVGLWWFERRLPTASRRARRLPRREVEILARCLADMARARIGALVVLRGRDVIARHLDGGELVQGWLSEPLLRSIFDPHSPGHDGALIIEGGRIDRLGCHLPLSRNLEKIPNTGTRHAAALGLSERTDALCLVVSEERGTLSAARGGEVQLVEDTSDLIRRLEAFYDEIAPPPTKRTWGTFVWHNYREKTIALGLALALWLVVVHRSQPVRRTFAVPVTYGLLPAELVVARLSTNTIHATFVAPRQAFEFLKTNDIKLALQLSDAWEGEREIAITQRELTFPSALELEDIEPRRVRLDIRRKPETNAPAVLRLPP